ncbi:MAG: hypothetical protein ACXW3Z_12480, partial [Limisphaerales bacterium]
MKLLVLDWRFSCLVLLMLATITFAVALPAKIWQRTPAGFTPEVKISALDFIQASALSRSARRAELRGGSQQALQSWSVALANDPCDRTIAANYIKALLRSKKRDDAQRALQIAGWLCRLYPDPSSHQFLIAAADRNEHWDLVLDASRIALESSSASADVQGSVLKALFRTGRYRDAQKLIERSASGISHRDLYAEALDCILKPNGETTRCVMLKESLQSGWRDVETHEIYLITCAAKQDLAEFQKTLASLKEITDQTLALDVLHVRLLLQLGRWSEAREVTALFRAPRSGLETFEIAEALVAVGDQAGAIEFLRGFCSEFQDSTRHLVFYARLLLKEADLQKLRALKSEIQKHPLSAIPAALAAGITCLINPDHTNLSAFTSALNHLPRDRSSADVWYFSSEILVRVNRPDMACDVLTQIEPQHLQNSEFYFRLFAAAEANKDASLMRRVAERSYQLVPADPRAAGNYGAMLAMCGEQPERAVALSAACLRLNPESIPAKINHAAALINSELFGSADLILQEIDESSLTRSALNQLRFIQLKRAVKIGDDGEIRRLA